MPRKIPVVDDEAVLVETIASNLEQAGYRVVTASDALSTLEAARSEGPDLILLDLMLPGIDGLEVCRQLRRVDCPSSQQDYPPAQEVAQGGRPANRELLVGPSLRIDLAGRRVNCRGQDLELQPKQFELLTYLARNCGTILTRDQLLHM